ncbi:L,D-transpeptidase [Streptomyces sp. NPDC057702]|uniref:L,D-transpeptidase n=1 Tax=unclassified Streptomyces TaxID=2593676 RepID=UPI00367B0374
MKARTRNLSLAVGIAVAAGLTAATGTPAQAAGSYDYLVFEKNSGDQTHSKLTLYRHEQNGRTVTLDSWRAGSGTTTNSCTRNAGWLPNGTYQIPWRDEDYDGSKIKGYVVRLSDKKCANGTQRDDLFIHSEMTRTGGQGSAEPWRWDGDSDYKSNGCVKLRPADIKDLFRYPKPVKLIVK